MVDLSPSGLRVVIILMDEALIRDEERIYLFGGRQMFFGKEKKSAEKAEKNVRRVTKAERSKHALEMKTGVPIVE